MIFQAILNYKTDHWEHFIDEVASVAARRRADALADRIKIDVRDSARPMDEILDAVNESVTGLIMQSTSEFTPESSADGIDKTMEIIMAQMANQVSCQVLTLGRISRALRRPPGACENRP